MATVTLSNVHESKATNNNRCALSDRFVFYNKQSPVRCRTQESLSHMATAHMGQGKQNAVPGTPDTKNPPRPDYAELDLQATA